jgi:hypothetical protein
MGRNRDRADVVTDADRPKTRFLEGAVVLFILLLLLALITGGILYANRDNRNNQNGATPTVTPTTIMDDGIIPTDVISTPTVTNQITVTPTQTATITATPGE